MATSQKIDAIRALAHGAYDERGELRPLRDQIGSYFMKDMPTSDMFVVAESSSELGIPNGLDAPLMMTQNTFNKITEVHEIEPSLVADIAHQIQVHVLAMESITRPNSTVLVLDAKDKDGKDIIAAVHCRVKKDIAEIDEIASVYGKEHLAFLIENTEAAGKKIFVNERTGDWVSRTGLPLPERTFNHLSKLLYDFEVAKRINVENMFPELSDFEVDHDPDKRGVVRYTKRYDDGTELKMAAVGEAGPVLWSADIPTVNGDAQLSGEGVSLQDAWNIMKDQTAGYFTTAGNSGVDSLKNTDEPVEDKTKFPQLSDFDNVVRPDGRKEYWHKEYEDGTRLHMQQIEGHPCGWFATIPTIAGVQDISGTAATVEEAWSQMRDATKGYFACDDVVMFPNPLDFKSVKDLSNQQIYTWADPSGVSSGHIMPTANGDWTMQTSLAGEMSPYGNGDPSVQLTIAPTIIEAFEKNFNRQQERFGVLGAEKHLFINNPQNADKPFRNYDEFSSARSSFDPTPNQAVDIQAEQDAPTRIQAPAAEQRSIPKPSR